MTHRWPTRALVAVAVPALLVPAVSSSAVAAPKPPAVPTLAAVAEIYPHLDGGDMDVTRERKIRMPQSSCKRGDVVKGATGQEAMYGPSIESMEDVEEYEITGQEPMVSVTTEVFPSARVASQYLRASLIEGQDCDEYEGDEDQMKKIRFKLGSERWGFQVKTAIKKDPLIGNLLLMRVGSKIVGVISMSMSGKTAPSIPKTIALARLALKAAR